MKILIYAYLFPPSLGGMQCQNLAFANGLYSLGYDIEVVACNNKGAKEFISGLNFPVYLLPKWSFTPMDSLQRRGWLNWVLIPWYFSVIRHRIKTFNPDVVFVADETSNCFWGSFAKHIKIPYVSYCSVPCISSLYKKGKRIILREMGHVIRCQLIRSLLYSYKNAEFVLVVSNSTRKELSNQVPEITSKIHIVPNSIDDKFFNMPADTEISSKLKKKLGIKEEHFVILSVTRLTIDKGVDDVIKALTGLDKSILQNIRYAIVGEGEAEAYLKELVNSLNLNKNVIFTGGISHLDLIPYYDMCDLFILPSRRGSDESFGRVFVEASARSKPSIGVNEGGMVDIIEDGKTGFLVSTGDVKAISDKIKCLMVNLEKTKILGNNARIKAEKMYTSKAVALQLEEFLKKAIEGTR